MIAGLKVWSYLVPKDLSDDAEVASAQYLEMIKSLDHISNFTEDALPKIAEVHNYFLRPGTIL